MGEEQTPDEPSGPFMVPVDRTARIESEIERAIAAGEFDDLPGKGKPLRGIGGRMDPDWWIRQKIADEGLTGLGPASVTLTAEAAALSDHLDTLRSERDVREALEDFNRRVRDARRQLTGGPPVFTKPSDVEAEVDGWRSRRAARRAPAVPPAGTEPERAARPSWRERQAARRAGR